MNVDCREISSPCRRGRSSSKFFFPLDSGISKWKAWPNNWAAGIWWLSPPPRTFYVHKQKSLEQLRRISSNSLTGCFVALTKAEPALWLPSMFLCLASLSVIFGRGSGEDGDVERASAGGALAWSTRSPISTERLRQETEWTNSSWIRPASPDISQTPSEEITGKRPGNHVALGCCQLYKVDQENGSADDKPGHLNCTWSG